jgi:class 3 adenylate cyclase
MALSLTRANREIDVRPLLESIQVPTLLVHGTGDRTIHVEASRYMQQRIPGARLLEINSEDHLPFWDYPDQTLSAVEEFLTGKRTATVSDRVVCTIMFTDIVNSTRRASDLGDRRWRDLLEQHHKAIRQELSVYRGREIGTAGDGFYAGFDGPARAIACGKRLVEAVIELGLSIRVGIHTGECEIKDGETTGLAIHIGARVSALAPADTVLVSQTVKELVAGSGIEFEDFGMHMLKGVQDSWHLYAVKGIARTV